MSDAPPNVAAAPVPFKEAFWTWARIAGLSFGGPAGQIAVMHRILVEEKRWIGETRFLHALNYCMLLPGPEAHELAIYIGWLMHRVRGGIVAGVLFVLPGLVALTALSLVYAEFGHIGVVEALFFGLKAAVLAVVLEAVVRVGKRALKSRGLIAIAALAFLGIFAFGAPFPLIVLSAAILGYAGSAGGLEWFKRGRGHGSAKGDRELPAIIDAAFAHGLPQHAKPSLGRFVKAAVIGGVVWLGPLLVLLCLFGAGNVFTSIAAFNSKMAVVTFGGAYAVLAYMAQQAVQTYHWLRPGEMLVGLGFAETTPGPLISVVEFVGFMAAFRQSGTLAPPLAGVLGGFLAMWSTFVPPFIWIFLGGPYMEGLIGNKSLNAALSAITAAVVGVILNLAVWFALHTIFAQIVTVNRFGLSLGVPVLASVNLPTLILSLSAIVAMFRLGAGMLPTFAACSAAGVVYYLFMGLQGLGSLVQQ
ncbi:MAG TPA: chromate efflux transporter [Rhizomicrobium sp.]|jgi:chromate transporter|nr:chromate efflux transporter [Rhizomicrobium sp.]